MSNACIECAMADCDISAADQHTQQGTQRNRLRTLMRSTMDDVLRLSSSRSRCPKRRSRAQKKSHLRLILPSRLRQRFDDTEFPSFNMTRCSLDPLSSDSLFFLVGFFEHPDISIEIRRLHGCY